jgi:hypothetical protein
LINQLHRRSLGKVGLDPTKTTVWFLRFLITGRKCCGGTFVPIYKYSAMTKTLFCQPKEGLGMQPTKLQHCCTMEFPYSSFNPHRIKFPLLMGLLMGHVRPSGWRSPLIYGGLAALFTRRSCRFGSLFARRKNQATGQWGAGRHI